MRRALPWIAAGMLGGMCLPMLWSQSTPAESPPSPSVVTRSGAVTPIHIRTVPPETVATVSRDASVDTGFAPEEVALPTIPPSVSLQVAGERVATRADALTDCWAASNAEPLDAELELTIATDGLVDDLALWGADADLADCVVAAVEDLAFPQSDLPTVVRLPMFFERS